MECRCCQHPARDMIDTFCREREIHNPTGETIQTAAELRDALAMLHPDALVPSEASISNHRRRHIAYTISETVDALDRVLRPFLDNPKQYNQEECRWILERVATLIGRIGIHA